MMYYKLITFFIFNLFAISPSLCKRCDNEPCELSGLIAPVFTPIDEDGNLNLGLIPAYAQYLVNNDIRAVVVGAYTGEGPKLCVEEVKRLISAWLDVAHNLGISVGAFIGGRPFAEVIELAKFAESSKVDAVVVLAELFYKSRSPEELVYTLEVIAQFCPSIAMILYDAARLTSSYLDIVEIVNLASLNIPTFKGVGIDDAEDGLRVQRVLLPDQRLYIANSSYLAPAVYLGITDFVFTEVSIFPDLVKAIIDNGSQGRLQQTNSLFLELLDLTELIFESDCSGHQIPAYKAAMNIVTGLNVGPPRNPEREISYEQEMILRQNLQGQGYGCNK